MTGTNSSEILFFIAISPTKLGGIELFAHELALALGRAGRRITFCFSTPASEEVARLFDMPNARLTHLKEQSRFSRGAVRELRDLLRRERPAAVVYSFGSIVRPLPWLCRAAGVKHVVYNDHASRVPGDATDAPPKRWLKRLLTAPVEEVIAVSEFVAACSRREKLHGARVLTIPNGIDLSRRAQSATREEFLTRFGIPSGRKIVTQLSWLVKEKGVDLFLTAAAEVLRQDANVHFVVGGEGAGRQELEHLAGELGLGGHVTFTGKLADPITSGLYAASDVFCLASRWQEACGLVLLEAMSFGVPVVATRTGGIPEFVRDGVDGLLVEGDAADYASAMLALVKDDDRRRTMGGSARRRVEEEFDVRRMAARYAEDLITMDH
ncbi:MAG: glycosyltransferase family 4 protein [Acidobacteriota bacterium]|nr:glycosyltransferase family 4 protein [Acidobacteriota bacterium]